MADEGMEWGGKKRGAGRGRGGARQSATAPGRTPSGGFPPTTACQWSRWEPPCENVGSSPQSTGRSFGRKAEQTCVWKDNRGQRSGPTLFGRRTNRTGGGLWPLANRGGDRSRLHCAGPDPGRATLRGQPRGCHEGLRGGTGGGRGGGRCQGCSHGPRPQAHGASACAPARPSGGLGKTGGPVGAPGHGDAGRRAHSFAPNRDNAIQPLNRKGWAGTHRIHPNNERSSFIASHMNEVWRRDDVDMASLNNHVHVIWYLPGVVISFPCQADTVEAFVLGRAMGA